MSRTVLMLLLSLVFVAACGPTRGGGGGGDDDDSAGDDDDDDDDDAAGDDDDAVPDTETDCDDGVDEDADGATDCADDDCAEVAPCFWPDAIDHAGDFDFDGWEIECDVGFPIDVDVDDCQTAYTSLMTESTGCDVCDRTYAGTFAYSVDSCAELIGEDSPSSGSFGFVFHSPTQWEIYAQNDAGGWESVGETTDDGAGNHVISGSDVVSGDPEDCDNGEQDLGMLTVTLTWRAAAP